MKKLLTIILLCCSSVLSAQNYQIGDVFTAPDGSQGIVYYLFPNGSGGWVVALNDASPGCSWGLDTDVPQLGNWDPSYNQVLLADTSGYANTQAIRDHYNDNSFAAGVVDFDHGWVLPSPAQLAMLYSQLPFISSAINGAGGSLPSNDRYWCSAERGYSHAWSVNFGNSAWSGEFSYVSKSTTCRVRAVRSFNNDMSVALSYVWSTGATTPSITVSPNQTTTYTVTVSSYGGGSDSDDYTVIVGNHQADEFSVTSPVPYYWDGTTYYYSGDYLHTYNTVWGCDSVVTLHLIVTMTPEATVTAVSDTICEDAEVTLQAGVLNAEALVLPSPPPAVAVGDILCTDSSIVKPSAWPVVGKTAMGVVFYVDASGEHGWAVHLLNQNTSVIWTPSNRFNDIYGLPNYAIGSHGGIYDMNGYSNTQRILAAGNSSQYPAAWAVDFDNGWYLPAAGQLRIMYAVIPVLNSTLSIVMGSPILEQGMISQYASSRYWSSTECNLDHAWSMNCNGEIGPVAKNTIAGVRSIRTF